MKGIFWEGNIEHNCIAQILSEVYLSKVYAPFCEGKQLGTVIDAGANIGLTAMYFAQFAKRVIAIEPSPSHYVCLREMIEYNALSDKIDPIQIALSDLNGVSDFHVFDGNTTMGTISPGMGWKAEGCTEVCTIGYLMNYTHVSEVDLLKLDIEGGEGAVIRSSSFADCAPKIKTIVGEWHTWSDISREEMASRLRKLGFTFRWLTGVNSTMFAATRETDNLAYGGIGV